MTAPEQEQHTVQCARCELHFEEAYPGGCDTGQGYECACEVRDDLIRGHYGSTRHDMSVYEAATPLGLPSGASVCDDCVDTLLAEGVIVLRQEGVW